MSTREKTAADIMTRDVVTVYEENNLNEVRTKLREHSFHHLPVIDGTKVVGMLSQRDMLRATITGVDRGTIAQAREARYLEQTFVRDVMQTHVHSAFPTDSLQTVARRLRAPCWRVVRTRDAKFSPSALISAQSADSWSRAQPPRACLPCAHRLA